MDNPVAPLAPQPIFRLDPTLHLKPEHRKTPKVVVGALLLIVGAMLGLLASKYLFVFNRPSAESICRKGGYQSVRSCGGYFIAERPCCDQGADILNNRGIGLVTCDGFSKAPDSPESECEKLLKTVDTNNCQVLACSSQDAQKVKSQYPLWVEVYRTVMRWLSGSVDTSTDSKLVSNTTVPPTIDPTSNWKTYTSEKLGFNFKYPDSYFKYLKDFPDIGIYLAPSQGNMAGPAGLEPDDVWLDVTTSSGANLKSLDEFIALQGQGTMYINIQGKSPVLIGGVPGYKITRRLVDGNVPVANYEGIILKDEVLYHLILSAHIEEGLVKNEQLFDQILSTFKLLECGGPNKIICPAGKACRLFENFNLNPISFGTCVSEAETNP